MFSSINIKKSAKNLLKEAADTSWILFKILIPITIITRLLKIWGVVGILGDLLAPVMNFVNLPGEIGLVWATGMITNIYGAMVVFSSLAPSMNLTVAQVTVLTTMILVAHSLPVELRIAQKAGVRMRAMLVLRITGALVLGFILSRIYSLGGLLRKESVLIWESSGARQGWIAWAKDQFRNLVMIYLVILIMLFMMKVLKKTGITARLTKILKPVLAFLGLSRDSAPITIIGMALGISYGGGLIIKDVQSGKLEKDDVFFALALMGLCHSLFEDTMLMVLLGGHLSGILFARLFFALICVYLLVKLYSIIPGSWQKKYLVR